MSASHFRRYTTLPYLLDMLREKRLPLLDPASWDDKNDAQNLVTYKKKKGFKSVLALCIADAPEAYQHWKIYANNSSGVCIEFHRENLINKFNNQHGFLHGCVRYVLLKELRQCPPSVDDLPFIKRFAYQDESEYRFIFTSSEEKKKEEKKKIEYISIDINDIKQIVINPWVESPVYKSMELAIAKTPGWEKVNMRQSTVTKNDAWMRMCSRAVEGARRYELTEEEIAVVEGRDA
jgi:hypothetical protein